MTHSPLIQLSGGEFLAVDFTKSRRKFLLIQETSFDRDGVMFTITRRGTPRSFAQVQKGRKVLKNKNNVSICYVPYEHSDIKISFAKPQRF